MAGRRGRGGSKNAKIREAMSEYGTRVEGNFPVWGSFGVGMDGPAKLIQEGTRPLRMITPMKKGSI